MVIDERGSRVPPPGRKVVEESKLIEQGEHAIKLPSSMVCFSFCHHGPASASTLTSLDDGLYVACKANGPFPPQIASSHYVLHRNKTGTQPLNNLSSPHSSACSYQLNGGDNTSIFLPTLLISGNFHLNLFAF